jgi:hypothetical protein
MSAAWAQEAMIVTSKHDPLLAGSVRSKFSAYCHWQPQPALDSIRF